MTDQETNYDRCLAIDPGAKLGWAVIDHGKVTNHDHVQAGKGKGLPTMPYIETIADLMRTHAPDIVASEGMLIVSKQSGGLAYAKAVILVEVTASLHGLDHDYVYPASWRAHFNMPAKKDKKASILWANRFAKNPITDDNEAEAVLLGIYHFAAHGIKRPEQLNLL